MQKDLPPLWRHQLTGCQLALEKLRQWFAFFMEMGTGKSRTLLEVLRYLFNSEGRVLHTLILCPSIVVENWPVEIEKYTNIPKERVIVLKGPGAKRRKDLAAARMKYPEGFIVITNYEALVSIKDLYEDFLDWRPEVFVSDESQRLKSHNSKRTKKAIELGDRARYRYILSGSPILNSPMDVWAQFRVCDRGATFGKNFFGFRNKYFIDKNSGMPRDKYFPNFVLREGALAEIERKISDNAMIVKKADCLDLPPLIRQVVKVELSPAQRKHYEEMKNDFITYVNDKACVAQLAITKAMRLQQIVSGHMPVEGSDEDYEKRHDLLAFEDTPREQALEALLEDILEDPKHKVLIWACWRANYGVIRKVCERLGQELVEVHGGISETGKSDAVARFRNDPNCRIFLGHPGSGGVGINLVEAQYMIYYSRNFRLEDDLQSEARNYRGGSEIHERITRYDLVADRTIDEEIQKALAQKKQIGDKLLISFSEIL